MKQRSDQSIAKHFYKRSLLKNSDNVILENSKADVTLVTKKTKQFFDNKNGYTVVDKRLIDSFSPDMIDSRVFWREATRHFPWIPICGNPFSRSKEDVNQNTWGVHSSFVRELSRTIYEKNPKAKMLEIGPGYGNVKNYIQAHHGSENYYCIDVNPLFEYERMFQTDGKTIPDAVPDNLDIAYSVNVFQHLSENQRRSYFEQIGRKLKRNGVFVFSMFIVNRNNRKRRSGNGRLFGTEDEEGNCYSSFFNQFIRIPREYEVIKELKRNGLTVKEKIRAGNNVFFWTCKEKQ